MIYLLPVIAALIGWVTNYLAIKMLFHPKKPVKIIFFTIQGIFPKRQDAIAERLGKVVAEQLFSAEDVKKTLLNDSNLATVSETIDTKIEEFLRVKLPQSMPMLAMFINDQTVAAIKTPMVKEIEATIPEILEKFQQNLDNDKIKETVKEKVKAFSSDKLEELLFSILKKEFKFIELIGAILGFIIGCLQLLMMYL